MLGRILTDTFTIFAAHAAARLGLRDIAARHAERALVRDPDMVSMHELLTSLYIRGEPYTSLLARIHAHLRPRTYVEIGVETGQSLCLVQQATQAIGIDPNPQLRYALPPGARVFSETSDDFFAKHDLRALLGGLPVDLAFIDGMHHFEYALRDFINLERCCAPGSTILADDCFPHDRRTAQRKRVTTFWSGDVWKLVVLLKKYRPDLAIHVVAAPPTGLCIIRKLDPASTVLADNLARIIEEFMALDYAHLARDRAGKLNLFPNDWERVRGLL